jgi:hypothetical protein
MTIPDRFTRDGISKRANDLANEIRSLSLPERFRLVAEFLDRASNSIGDEKRICFDHAYRIADFTLREMGAKRTMVEYHGSLGKVQ